MQLVDPINLLPPSICIVCETQPDGEFVVDTLYNLRTGVASVFNGRKYVCERCVLQFAELFGLVSRDKEQKAVIASQVARDELANVRARVEELTNHIRDFVNSPGAALEGVEAPKPERTPASVRFEDFTDVPDTDTPPDVGADNRSVGQASPKSAKDVSK
jgi:hypothetical protein